MARVDRGFPDWGVAAGGRVQDVSPEEIALAQIPAKRARTVKSEPFKNGSNQDKSNQNHSDFTVGQLVSLSGMGAGELQFVSDDWSDYADLSKLPRRSGVTSSLLRRLVLKELVDNALDEC